MANAGLDKVMSYDRMKQVEPTFAAEVESWLAQADRGDKVEDRHYCRDRYGDEMPVVLANNENRLAGTKAVAQQ